MHPVSYDIAYEPERNRLTVFFRLLLAIPWIIVAYVYGLLAYVAAFISWFALLFTGRYPQGLYGFVAGFVRFTGRVGPWVALATDEFPSLGGKPDDDYPVAVDVAPPQASYGRARTFFKLVLYFPQAVLGAGVQALISGAALVSWWRIVFTGKQSVTMHDALRVAFAYYTRSTAFLLLLTEVHPRLLDLPPQQHPADAPGMPPAQAPAPTPPRPATA